MALVVRKYIIMCVCVSATSETRNGRRRMTGLMGSTLS